MKVIGQVKITILEDLAIDSPVTNFMNNDKKKNMENQNSENSQNVRKFKTVVGTSK